MHSLRDSCPLRHTNQLQALHIFSVTYGNNIAVFIFFAGQIKNRIRIRDSPLIPVIRRHNDFIVLVDQV
ncbi:hypothetical protein D3C78_1816940 [compost metagenome]